MGGGTYTPSLANHGYEKLNFTPKGAQVPSIYRDRIRNFTATGQYENVNLRSMFVFDREPPLSLKVHSVPDLQRPLFKDVVGKVEFKKEAKLGDRFGPSWSTHWFEVKIRVPERMAKYERVQWSWDANCEGLVYMEDGEAVQGLTGGGERVEWVFPQEWKKDGKEHVFYVEIACNGMFGNAENDIIQPPKPDRTFGLSQAEIVAPNLEAWGLYIDFWILGDASREFSKDSWESHRATQVANEIINQFETGNQKTVINGRKIAAKYLGEKRASHKVYDGGEEPLVFATGHCHIDTAWLWPFDETKRKVARSWASQCKLMDLYPEHRFSCSSAQQYKWLEQFYPKTFERVRQKVHEGNFQYIGGSWVEHDTNMPSGESLTRQFILGQRYFQSRFGARCNTFWLPDTFGYSAQLPQLCRLAGMTRFFTQKLSWNNVNVFPHTTFNWIALDGTQVLCHMPPSETYTAQAHFGDVVRSVTQHKSLDQDNTSLLVFGHGDGGGGPTMEQIEKLRRCRGITDTIGKLPRVHMGTSVDSFFEELEKKNKKNKFVTWYGELYLEFHRGTYTTQANNKKGNRKAEVMMRDLEMMATYASLKIDRYKYPKKDIDDMWEDICLMQFHDCLPGSCIEMVYRDTDKIYAALFEKGKEIMDGICKSIGLVEHSAGLTPTVMNTHPWSRGELVQTYTSQSDAEICQSTRDGQGYILYNAPELELGRPYDRRSIQVSLNRSEEDVYVLENDNIKVTVKDGVITSLYHRGEDREVIPQGRRANQLVIFDDKPLYWQAWDVEVFHFDSRKELNPNSVKILESGPLRATLQVETKISDKSWIKTNISLDAGGQYVTFDCEVEWHETMKFLKVEFPMDVYNTEACYETQYGILKRPTHYNTSWDMAKFEVCCQKWADLSEHGFGVSILNNCKYGFATTGNLMRLSLLRAPKAPDAHADMGRHNFSYAIFPHSGSVGHATVRAAADFNNPMSVRYTSDVSCAAEFIRTVSISGSPAVMLDCVKRGEDDEDVSVGGIPVRKGRSVVVRLYEALGGRAKAKVHSKLEVKKAFRVNLLEDDEEELEWCDGGVEVVMRPFEVRTLRLQL